MATAIDAAETKKAENVAILQMDKSSSAFTDYMVIGSGTNPRQVQAIADEVEYRLKQAGIYPNNIEGYQRAEWILLDYVDFVVHCFSEQARKFYDLERLWKSAKRISLEDLKGKASRASRVPVKATRRKPTKSKAVTAIGKAVRSATSRTRPAKKKSVAKKTTAKKSSKSKSRRRPR
ncbi:MAG TPA: ribosome silencing factor [Terriglobales bacterium]|nr:ribosome silencing factor [Terriglobales bacterium]